MTSRRPLFNALLLCLPGLWMAAAEPAPPANAECRWTPGLYSLGDPVVLDVKLPVESADFFLTGLPPAGTDWAAARVVSSRQEQPASFPGMLTLSITLQVFDIGEVALPPVLFSVNTSGGAKPFLVQPPPLQVKALLKEGDGPPPAAQVVAYPKPGLWGVFLLGFAVLAALAAAAGLLLKRMRQPAALLPPPQKLDPDAWIRAEVARLMGSGVEPAFRYGALSRCLREYLEIKTGLPFPDWTTHEIRASMDRVPRLDDDAARALVRLLVLCDQVKFARYLPASDEEQAVRPALDAVLSAMRRPEPAAPEKVA